MELENKIITISGNARSGKDTLGGNFKKILNDSGIKAELYSFAEELKKSVNDFLIEKTGISAFTEDTHEKNLIRPFLVCWGTDIMRSIDDNIWIKKLEEQLKVDQVNIITDLRFPNELDWLKKNNGLSVFIDRSNIKPANKYEEENNGILRDLADNNFCIGDFDNDRYLELTANEILNSMITTEIYESWKATCPL
jgi:hypothetical protein